MNPRYSESSSELLTTILCISSGRVVARSLPTNVGQAAFAEAEKRGIKLIDGNKYVTLPVNVLGQPTDSHAHTIWQYNAPVPVPVECTATRA